MSDLIRFTLIVDLTKNNLYSDRWGGSGYYSKKKDLKEMQKKKYFEDLYYEFLNYFQEEEFGDD